jgi:hypothetical protein
MDTSFFRGETKMRKNKLVIILTSVLLLPLAFPAPSHAAPAGRSLSRPAAAAIVLDRLAQWWDLLSAGRASEPGAASRIQEKNGCGIDPQGGPLCGPGPGATPPPPADPGDLGIY